MGLAEWWTWFGPGWVALAVAAVALALPGTLWWAAGRGLAAVAVPQAALVGAAVGVLLNLSHGQIALPAALAAVLGGLVVRPGGAAVLLGAGMALPVWLVSGSPHGMNEVTDLTLSRILGLDWSGVWPSAVLAVGGVVVAATAHRYLRAAVLDPVWAASAGLHPRPWLAVLGIWGGLAVGVTLPAIGLIGVVGFLILPGLAARGLTLRLGHGLVAAPVLALISVLLAVPVAHVLDAPPVPVAVTIQAVITVVAYGLRVCAGR